MYISLGNTYYLKRSDDASKGPISTHNFPAEPNAIASITLTRKNVRLIGQRAKGTTTSTFAILPLPYFVFHVCCRAKAIVNERHREKYRQKQQIHNK